MKTILKIKDLEKKYKKGSYAVKGVSLNITKGEIFGLLGPNGAGKTTMINCIASLSTITSGKITILGHDVIQDYILARKAVGLSQQDIKHDPYFTIYELMIYQAGYYGIRKKQAIKRTNELLEMFDLKESKNKKPMHLSGGMKRKLSLAKALLHKPRLLILDEPTAALDVDTRRDLWKYIRKINNEGISVLLTTHYIEEAEKMCDRIAIINKGKIIKTDNTKDIMDELSENIITFYLRSKIDEKILEGYNYVLKADKLDILVPKKEQNRILQSLIALFSEKNIRYDNFEIRQDSLENIFLRIIKNDKN